MDISTDEDLWPMRFLNGAAAIRWADGYLNSPRVKSQIGDMTQKSGAIDINGNRLTIDSLDNLAGTISACLMQCEPPASHLYRHIYGRFPRTTDMAWMLTYLVCTDFIEGLTPEKVQHLALMVIEDTKSWLSDNKRFHYSQMAKDLGVTREVFNAVWLPLVSSMRDHIYQWRISADRDFELLLRDRGIL